jgi:hypothetical protein
MKMGLQRAVALCDKTRFMHHKEAKSYKSLDTKKDINWAHAYSGCYSWPSKFLIEIHKQVQAFTFHFAIMLQCWNLPCRSHIADL